MTVCLVHFIKNTYLWLKMWSYRRYKTGCVFYSSVPTMSCLEKLILKPRLGIPNHPSLEQYPQSHRQSTYAVVSLSSSRTCFEKNFKPPSFFHVPTITVQLRSATSIFRSLSRPESLRCTSSNSPFQRLRTLEYSRILNFHFSYSFLKYLTKSCWSIHQHNLVIRETLASCHFLLQITSK